MSGLGRTEQQYASHPVARAIQFAKPSAMGVDDATNDRLLSHSLGNEEGRFLLQSGSTYADKFLDADADINKVGGSTDGDAKGHKADGLQELLQLAEEYESEEAAKRKLTCKECYICGSSLFEDAVKEYVPLDTTKSAVKEETCQRAAGQRSRASNSKWSDVKKLVPHVSKVQVARPSSAPSLSVSKAGSKGSTKVQTEAIVQKRGIAENGRISESENGKSMNAVSQRLITTAGPSWSNCTVPRPFALATDKRACNGGRLLDGGSGGQAQKVHPLNGPFGNLSLKNSQVSNKMGSKLYEAKPAHSECLKHQEEILEKLIISSELKHAKDDMTFVSSVQAGSKAPKAKASNLTNSSSFNFRSEERAQKRKEFYARLEERLNAKEEEKNRMQEKTKEQNEEEIRKLRRSLTYKAHPIPSFYTEGHPAKPELKKIPPTRAKSPNFSRRNCHAGSESGCSRFGKFMYFEELYSTHSPHKSTERNTNNFSEKNNNEYVNKLVWGSPSKHPTDQLSECKSPRENNCPMHDFESVDVESVAVNGSMDKLNVEMSRISSLFPEHVMDEEKYGGYGAGDYMFSNPAGREHLCLENTKLTELKGTHVFAVTERLSERSMVNGSNDLQKGPAIGTDLSFSSSDKLTTGAKFQPFASDSSHDLTLKGNRTTKRERLKEVTPYFRRQESSQNLKQSAVDQDMGTMMADVTEGT